MDEIKDALKNEPKPEALIATLQENWLHVRHLAEQRAWHINLYMLVLTGTIAIAFREPLPVHQVVVNYWPVFCFLYILSLYIFFDVTKENLEISNHTRAIQWISEKLYLNKELSEERKRVIEKIIAEGKLSKEDKRDVMYQGYMALPLPIFRGPMRVHEWLMYLFMFCTAGASISGFFLKFNLLSFLTYFQFPGILLSMNLTILSAYLIGIIFGLGSCLYCRASVRQDKLRKLLDLREPDGIKLRYREEPYFWE